MYLSQKALYLLHDVMALRFIIRLPCQICGRKAEAHHYDYNKPLDVLWLCRSHHRRLEYYSRNQGWMFPQGETPRSYYDQVESLNDPNLRKQYPIRYRLVRAAKLMQEANDPSLQRIGNALWENIQATPEPTKNLPSMTSLYPNLTDRPKYKYPTRKEVIARIKERMNKNKSLQTFLNVTSERSTEKESRRRIRYLTRHGFSIIVNDDEPED